MSDIQRQPPPEDASDTAIRTSFSLDRYARERIRETAHTYGVPQSEIVNRSAKLFEFLAERSLQRRTKNLTMLKTLAEQVERSLKMMTDVAPHLGGAFGYAGDMVSNAVEGEDSSILKKMVYGAEADGDLVDGMDLKDSDLMEKLLADEFPELGPHRFTSFDLKEARAENITLDYYPYGSLSTGRISKVTSLLDLDDNELDDNNIVRKR